MHEQEKSLARLHGCLFEAASIEAGEKALQRLFKAALKLVAWFRPHR
ncbi:MAG: hypothetical protein ACP5RC_03550 [Halothiobacillaceae bacterium]